MKIEHLFSSPLYVNTLEKKDQELVTKLIPVLEDDFYDAKAIAMEKKIIWNGTTQSYNKKQFNCNKASDKKLIKQFEIQFMNGLKSQG